MLGRDVLAVALPGQQHVVAVHVGEGQIRREVVLGVRHHELRIWTRLHQLHDLAERYTGPVAVEHAPAGHAVDVLLDGNRWQRPELLVRQLDRIIDKPRDLKIPLCRVELWHRAVVQDRPFLGLVLAGRQAVAEVLRALQPPLVEEVERHQITPLERYVRATPRVYCASHSAPSRTAALHQR